MAYKQGIDRKQVMLMPEAVEDYIDPDNPVQAIDAFVDTLDMREMGFTHAEPEATGRPPYHPADLLRLYLYGYLNRVRSSRSLEKETKRNLELLWLLKKLSPDFKTIADFRKNNTEALRRVSRQFVVLCRDLDLFGREIVAIDGSKFKAVNSKKRHVTKAKLARSLHEIDEKIDAYLKELDDNDRDEERLVPPGKEDLRRKLALLTERRKRCKDLSAELEATGEEQMSLTDRDAKPMLTDQHVEMCYNVQMSVDAKHKLVVDHDVTTQPKDSGELGTMALRAADILGGGLTVLADKGYHTASEIKACVDAGMTPCVAEREDTRERTIRFAYDRVRDCYVCPAGMFLLPGKKMKHHNRIVIPYRAKDCTQCPTRCTRGKRRTLLRWEHEHILEDMRRRMRENASLYRMRQCLSEHPLGTIKHAMQQGYFLLRGLEKVKAEISLSVLVYNIKRVMNILGVRGLREALA